MLFENCREFIPGELAVLQPDIIVTQGDEAKKVIVQACRVVKHERKDVEGLPTRPAYWTSCPGADPLAPNLPPEQLRQISSPAEEVLAAVREAVKQFVGGAPRQC